MSSPHLIQAVIKSHGIALTGGVATGKSTVAAMIRASGVTVIDADQLARDVMAPGTPGLLQATRALGVEILRADGSLDRARLGALVFASPKHRRELEAITHPLIRAALGSTLERLSILATPRIFFYEAALIVETGSQGDFRTLWATVCEPETQLQRLMARNHISREAAQRIIASQMPAAEKARAASVVIPTDGPLTAVEAAVKQHLRGVGVSC